MNYEQLLSPEERARKNEREGGMREAEGSKEAGRNLERLRKEDRKKMREMKRKGYR
jgi:hypothetical protein